MEETVVERMKIGIITFHRTANYGAILQAYALQEFLKGQGHDVYIIDYVPNIIRQRIRNILLTKDIRTIPVRIQQYRKYIFLNRFVNKKMKLTKRYTSDDELQECPPDFELFISGSDQIWNKYFTFQGEGKPTFTYFLDFVPEGRKKISYATSLGFCQTDGKYNSLVKGWLEKYSAISVRESSAQYILQHMGVKAILSPDPTLLLDVQDYDKMAFRPEGRFVVSYILHDNQRRIHEIRKKVEKIYAAKSLKIKCISIERWIGYISAAECIVTNSYHGMIFSILFHRPFIIVPVEGEGDKMNDRIVTLLNICGLGDRMVSDCEQVSMALDRAIDWGKVDEKLCEYRNNGVKFLKENIEHHREAT